MQLTNKFQNHFHQVCKITTIITLWRVTLTEISLMMEINLYYSAFNSTSKSSFANSQWRRLNHLFATLFSEVANKWFCSWNEAFGLEKHPAKKAIRHHVRQSPKKFYEWIDDNNGTIHVETRNDFPRKSQVSFSSHTN